LKKKIIENIETKHEGRGRFIFTPKPNIEYFLKIIKPSNIKNLIKLPQIQKFGATIITTKDCYESNDEITFKFASTDRGNYQIFYL